jgi:multidrug resistance efflux pump
MEADMMDRRKLVKFGYIGGLIWMVTWALNEFAGGHVYSSGSGMVVGDLGQISPEYTVTVIELLVRNGDKVNKGDVVARVSSSRVAEVTANLSAQSSTLINKMAEITSKSGMIDQLVSGAEVRDKTVDANAEQLREIREKKLLPLLTDNALAEQLFKGKQELALLRAEKETMSVQVANIIAASRFTDQALVDIQALYDAGRMKAPMDGFISGIEAGIGSVINPGQLVAEMVGEQRYVLAYYPISRLYDLKVGAPVTIDVGLANWLHGSITRVEPIAARLPKEFQRVLSAVERQQLVRIDFNKDVTPPPYFTKVTVR